MNTVFYKYLNFIILITVVSLVFIAPKDAIADQCVGAGGRMETCSPPVSGGGNRGSGSIFNRNSSSWGNSGWNTGGGAGGGGSIGGLFGSRFYVGRNSVGIGGPGGSIQVGRNVLAGGSGAGGAGFGGYNEQINAAACTVLGIPMGSFGALVMAVAGIIAIVAGALGGYKMALSTIVIGAGSWVLFPVVSMFFPLNCGF